MAEWLVEEGIGETRSLLVEGDRVLAARLHWPGDLYAGAMVEARLTTRAAGARRGTATLADGTQILVDRLARDHAEGGMLRLEIVRAPIAERGRLKLALARPAEADAPGAEPAPGRRVPRFAAGLWEEVWSLAWEARADFGGGSLLFAPTPAMTLIDIDGQLAPSELARAAVPAIARSVRLLDIGGSIGFDFPSLAQKDERRALDRALDEALAGWPHERTAMNGFGFVQLVARLDGPSLLQRIARQPFGAAARAALRRAERCEGSGRVLHLALHPRVAQALAPQWLDELARRSGRQVIVAQNPNIAPEAGHAQISAA